VIEELAAIADTVPEPAPEPVMDIVAPTVSGPHCHIIFPSSSSDSGSEERKRQQELGKEEENEEDEEEEDGDDQDEDCRAKRSTYVGRGNVQAVRAARKAAGLNDAFPRTDPLLIDFRNFMKMAAAAERHIPNVVII